jgi:hypothetical protein
MSLAEPLRSRIAPMKMNIGIDTSTGSAATPPHKRSRMLDRPIRLKASNDQAMSAKTSAVPPSTNATG